MSYNQIPLKSFNKYSIADFQKGDEIQVEEQEKGMPTFRHSYRGFVKSISGNQIIMEISHIFDADIGGKILNSSPSITELQVQASNIRMARRGTIEF